MKKRSEMTVEEKMNFILDGATWEEAKEVGCLILGKVVAKAVHVDGNKDIFHELFETVAKKGDQWVQDGGSWYLAMAKSAEIVKKTNECKAIEIAIENGILPRDPEEQEISHFNKHINSKMLLQMAEWKDHQFYSEKKELIDKACEAYRNDLLQFQVIIGRLRKSAKNLIDIEGSVDDFRKAIGGGSL